MGIGNEEQRSAVAALLSSELTAEGPPPADYLVEHGHLPGPAANLALVRAALRKGLGYTLSVVSAGPPLPTFERMPSWADEARAKGDRDLRWVLGQDLRKGRLAKRYPEEVAVLLDLLA